MEEINAVVAGAGIWGCTVARRLAEDGKKVLVLEKRRATGGNVRCETDPETGITYDILYDILIKQNGDIHGDWDGKLLDVDAYEKVVFEPYDLCWKERTAG